ncbi:hypothetical protein RJT34_17272 [Clitoria ternatea]|uniref:Uncharacterized protein n=1 Tax=Clitoria ternatea TaxID=43366 RepID=A0AAN9J907_CLITE
MKQLILICVKIGQFTRRVDDESARRVSVRPTIILSLSLSLSHLRRLRFVFISLCFPNFVLCFFPISQFGPFLLPR